MLVFASKEKMSEKTHPAKNLELLREFILKRRFKTESSQTDTPKLYEGGVMGLDALLKRHQEADKEKAVEQLKDFLLKLETVDEEELQSPEFAKFMDGAIAELVHIFPDIADFIDLARDRREFREMAKQLEEILRQISEAKDKDQLDGDTLSQARQFLLKYSGIHYHTLFPTYIRHFLDQSYDRKYFELMLGEIEAVIEDIALVEDKQTLATLFESKVKPILDLLEANQLETNAVIRSTYKRLQSVFLNKLAGFLLAESASARLLAETANGSITALQNDDAKQVDIEGLLNQSLGDGDNSAPASHDNLQDAQEPNTKSELENAVILVVNKTDEVAKLQATSTKEAIDGCRVLISQLNEQIALFKHLRHSGLDKVTEQFYEAIDQKVLHFLTKEVDALIGEIRALDSVGELEKYTATKRRLGNLVGQASGEQLQKIQQLEQAISDKYFSVGKQKIEVALASCNSLEDLDSIKARIILLELEYSHTGQHQEEIALLKALVATKKLVLIKA